MSHLYADLKVVLAFVTAGLVLSCAAGHRQEAGSDEDPTVVRVVRFVIAEGNEAAWSSACHRLAVAAIESHIDANWLVHRIDNRNYYLVSFGSSADFASPNAIVNGFRRHDVKVLEEEFEQLRAVAYRVTSDEVWEQVPAWGTTSEMNSLTHPGVDQRSYRVPARHLGAVDSVLTEMASLLNRERYPNPIEGFRVDLGAEVVVHVTSFFGPRDDYYSKGRPETFLAARGRHQQWLRLVERLDALTHEQSRTQSEYVHELSYDPWLLEQLPMGSG